MPARRYVLYADDDQDDREMLELFFRDHPAFELRTFADGIHLWEYLLRVGTDEICLVMLDVNMPLQGGLQTLELIRQSGELQGLDILMFSTSSNPLDKQRAEKLGARFVTKPLSLEHFRKVAGEILAYCRPCLQR